MKKLLITSRQRRTLSNKNVYFLGCWALSTNQLEDIRNHHIHPYHWDDREKLYKDYCYLDDLYERLLPILSKSLNQLHNTSHTIRFWRIVIGPWLATYIHVIFDRWEIINSLKFSGESLYVNNIEYQDEIPDDYYHFLDLVEQDEFNNILFFEIIKFTDFIKTEDPITKIKISKEKKSVSLNFYSKLRLAIFSIFKKLFKKEIIFFDSYLPLGKKTLLEIKLKQIPYIFNIPSFQTLNIQNTTLNRNDLKVFFEPVNLFERFLLKNLPKTIPKSYVEGFSLLYKRTNNFYWKHNPKVIISGVVHHDDFKKIWLATKVEFGSKLIVEQHGGHYGMGKFSFSEKHEISISDVYLSWGWNNDNNKVKPVSHPKLISNISYNPNGKVLHILMSLPRYAYRLYAVPIASQVMSYENDQLSFLNSLDGKILQMTKVKAHPTSRGYDLKTKIKINFPNLELIEKKSKIYDEIKQSRVVVCSYNATTVVECLVANVPTIMFWNQKHWELNSNSEYFFNKLKQVNILHESPTQASIFLNKNFHCIEKWWNEKKTQDALKEFINQYGLHSQSWKDEWLAEINKLK